MRILFERHIASFWQAVLAFIVAAFLALFAQSAIAQTASDPEAYRNVDEFGVDLVSGTYNLAMLEAEAGSDANSLPIMRYWTQAGWRDNWSGYLRQQGSTVTITFGNKSDSFTASGAVWVSQKANGGKLTSSTSAAGLPTYLYIAADGTEIQYEMLGENTGGDRVGIGGPAGYCVAAPLIPGANTAAPAACAVPKSITYSNTNNVTLTWIESPVCISVEGPIPGEPVQECTVYYRLEKVAHSSGFVADIRYQSNTIPGTAMPPAVWYQQASLRIVNRAVDHCGDDAFDCNIVQNWPQVTYANPASNVQEVTMQNGGVWRFTFTTGRIASIRSPGSVADNIIITYDAAGKVTSVTKDGELRNYTWGTGGDVAVADPQGPVVNVIPSTTTAQPDTVTTPSGQAIQYLYDFMGRVTRKTMPEGDYTTYSYNADGQVTQVKQVAKAGSGLADIIISAGFDVNCAANDTCSNPAYTIDAKGNRTDYTYHPVFGGITRVQLAAPAAGQPRPQTDYVYSLYSVKYRNAAGTLITGAATNPKVSLITSCKSAATCAGTANETRTAIEYNTPNLLPTKYTTSSGDGLLTSSVTLAYDDNGRVISQDGPLAGTDDAVYIFYDSAGRRRGVIGVDPDGAGTRPRLAERYTFNSANAVTKTETGTVAGVTAANLDSMTVAQTLDITFNAGFQKVRETLSAGGTIQTLVQYSYNLYRLECSALRMNPATYTALPASACTPATAGTAGPDRISKNSYDANDRVIKVESGIGTPELGNDVVTTFTANGQVATVTDGEGNKTAYSYDGHDRRIKAALPANPKGSGNISATDYEGYTYDAGGNVTSRRLRDNTTIGYSYDNLDRLTAKNLPGTETDATYVYDLAGHMTSAVQGQTLSFAFDALGRNTGATGPHGTVTYAYDIAGRRISMAYPGGTALTVRYDYDSAGNVLKIRENTATTGAGVLATYAYDNLGRRSSMTFGNGVVQSFAYDPASRLQSLTDNPAGTAQDQSATFTYNPASQIDTLTRTNNAYAWNGHYNIDRPYTSDALNRIVAAGALVVGYDGRGNITSSGSDAYTYTSENLMKSGPGGAALSYDPAGRLYQTSKGALTTRMQYDGSDLIAEYNAANVLQRRYVHGPGTDEPILWYEGSTLTDKRYLLSDERGSVTSITNAVGTVTNINSYDEYGIPAVTNTGRFGYTGQTWLPEIGMNYYKARMYSPTLGRFMQPDPIGYGDGMNLYTNR